MALFRASWETPQMSLFDAKRVNIEKVPKNVRCGVVG